MQLLESYSKLQFVMHEKAFQLVLYAAGFSNTDINEDFTNKIEWKKAHKFWHIDILDKLQAYNPFGPKGKPKSEYFMVNRMLDQISAFLPNLESLKEYSVVISRLFEFINIGMNIVDI